MSYKKMLPLVLAALLLWTVPASAAPETTLKVAVGDPEDSEMGVSTLPTSNSATIATMLATKAIQ